MIVFVYGTLLKGLKRWPILAHSSYMGLAMIRAELFDLGYFPGIKEGDNTVVGELYEISHEVLGQLDLIEGYDKDKPKDSFYLREEVPAQKFSDGSFVKACCYIYNHSDVGAKICHGDYRRYLLEQETQEQWVLAYGSNMSVRRLTDRVGEVNEYKKAFLENFTLVFSKAAPEKQFAYPNIAYAGNGDTCPAVAYKLSKEQIDILDGYEGVPTHYLRIGIPFRDDIGRIDIGQVYMAHPDELIEGMSPTAEHLAHIQRGYEEHGFADFR